MQQQEKPQIHCIRKGLVEYQTCVACMKECVHKVARTHISQLWQVEHPSVYTLGQAGKHEHLLDMRGQYLVQTDRGGQVTWHGPGQVVLYTIFHLKHLGIGPKDLIHTLENAVIALLAQYRITAVNKKDAPGVYVNGAKIASVGLRIRNGVSYHGLSFHHSCDLRAFLRINPCGYPNLPVTSLQELFYMENTIPCTEKPVTEKPVTEKSVATVEQFPDMDTSARILMQHIARLLQAQCIDYSTQ